MLDLTVSKMRNFIIIIIFLLVNSIFSLSSFSQKKNFLEELKFDTHQPGKTVGYDSLRSYNSEYDLIFTNLFLFYKKFVSSQDASSCSFTPSCSEYAILAIKKQGFIVGIINFWDRFSRCNGMSPEDYEVDNNVGLLIDPVRDIKYEEK